MSGSSGPVEERDNPAPSSHPVSADDHAPALTLTTQWRRLDVRMLIIAPVQALIRLIPSLIPIIIVGTATTGGGVWLFAFPLAGLAAAMGVISWVTTKFRITSEQLQLEKGLLQRNTLTAPLDRIRTVDVTASPLHRLLGLATVKIGTGSDTPFELDGLDAAASQELRSELLHVSKAAPQPGSPAADTASGGAEVVAGGGAEVELSRLSPSWIRYAPFTLSGAVAVLAGMGFIAQFIDDIGTQALQSTLGDSVLDYVQQAPLWLSILQGVVVAAILLLGASVATYALMYWNYSLTRHPGGTLSVRRGLLTTRHTTVEEVRLRGVILVRPLLLRWVGAAKAKAMVTGLSDASETGSSSSDLLVPPAPDAEVVRVLDEVLLDPQPMQCVLQQHGSAARRRRYTRALTGAVALGVPVYLGVWSWGLSWWWAVSAGLPLVLAAPVARGRYAVLGHALTDAHLVAASGLFPTERAVLRRSAIIGWTMQSSFFQRRKGLVTLRATLAASAGDIAILDVPQERAVRLMHAATPGLLDPYLEQLNPLKSRKGTRSATATARTG